jgi:iron complex outermembrane receptor protein
MDRAVAAPPRKPPDVPDRAARLTRGAWPRVLLIVGGLSAGTLPTPATADAVPAGSFSELSLEQLMEVDVVEVSSVGRQTRPLTETAAAAFVISSDDIRRSGATNIPEALRLAPGVEVARVDANKWAVSIRGFNGRFADKLLVMIDGMSVYTPFFCNVFWDVQDVPLDDIARIEVIRGPGGSVWGANAVNGVINIITKRARDTQGVLVSTIGGSAPAGSAAARYGGRAGAETFYRGYVKGLAQGDSASPAGGGMAAADAWEQRQAGFRVDTKTAASDPITVSGQLYRGNYGTTGITAPRLTPPYAVSFDDVGDVSGVNLRVNWEHALSERSAIETRAFYRHDKRQEQGLIFDLDTVDIDVHHQYRGLRRQALSSGFGYRFIDNRLDGTFPLSFAPQRRRDHLFSAFVQDEISLVRDRLRLTLGTKVEHNASTGVEVQPSARTIWTPNRRNALWAAASRAVRTPTIAEDDVRLNVQTMPPGAPGNPFPAPVLIRLVGDSDLDAEELYALEAGYRISPASTLSVDIAAFLNIYDRLRTFSAATPGAEAEPPPHGVVPFVATNAGKGTSHGLEAAARWTPTPPWNLQLAYTYLDLDLEDGGALGILDRVNGASPSHQLSLRSLADLGDGWELDLWPRYVAELPSIGVGSYVDLTARLGWRPRKGVDLSLIGQNLFDNRRREFAPEFLSMTPTQVQRALFARLTVGF